MKAIFFNVPTSGHVNPSLPLTAELVRRGEQVIYYLTEGYRTQIEKTGATFRPYARIEDDFFDRYQLDGSNPPLTSRILISETQAMLPDLLAIIRAEQPDYILYDSMCPWGALAARIAGVPSVSSLVLLLLSPATMIRVMGLRRMLPTMIRGLPNIRRFSQISKAIGQEYHIQPLSFTEFYNAPADLTISYTSPLIQPNADSFGASIQFVGPSIAPRSDNGDFPLAQLDGQTVIYISLGTVINDNPTFFQSCLAAFRDTAYTVVMSIGQKLDLATLGAIPANVMVRRHVPQLEVLQKSALFITHSGMNSVNEGLYYGVPLLMVPQQQEQTMVALRLQELGIGLMLDSQTPEAIRAAAERILNAASFRQQAAEVGTSLREAGGTSRAADLVLAMVKQQRKME